MGHDNKNKESGMNDTNASKITGSMKKMYYFLVGVSAVIPVLLLMKLMYLDFYSSTGKVVTHNQYYLWNSYKFLVKVKQETADGVFFLIVSIIPLILLLASFVNCIISLIYAFTEKISWKHGASINKACTSTIAATGSSLLILNIVGEFFELTTGLSDQAVNFNIPIIIALVLSIVGKVVAHYYFEQIRTNHLF